MALGSRHVQTDRLSRDRETQLPLTKETIQNGGRFFLFFSVNTENTSYVLLNRLLDYTYDGINSQQNSLKMPEQVRHIEWEEMDKSKFYFFGPTLFLGIRALLYPANLVKTRLQVQRKNALYKGSFDAFVKVIRFEGLRGLYKGFLVSSFGLLSGQCYITTLELIRTRTKDYNNAVRGFLAGGCASLVGQTITVPVDVVSQKMMVQGQGENTAKLNGASTIIREIVKSNGPLGLYRGYLISLMTYAPSSAIWWSSYGMYTGLVGNIVLSGTPHMLVLAIAGSMAGLTTATTTNPLDIMRTRLQVSCCCSLCFFCSN